MNELDYWRLCSSLTVVQAAALIAGGSPELVLTNNEDHYIPDHMLSDDELPSDNQGLGSKFQAALVALKHAIQDYAVRDGGIEARLIYRPLQYAPNVIDWDRTTVSVSDLTAWLASKGFTTGFFFHHREDARPGYLDPKHPSYAPKLAAAIRAWEAVTGDPELQRGKTPKQAISKWLNEHAALYGLTKDDGTPNAQGVEEISKMANWRPEGGASKTPGS